MHLYREYIAAACSAGKAPSPQCICDVSLRCCWLIIVAFVLRVSKSPHFRAVYRHRSWFCFTLCIYEHIGFVWRVKLLYNAYIASSSS